jgi:hypothetical protein
MIGNWEYISAQPLGLIRIPSSTTTDGGQLNIFIAHLEISGEKGDVAPFMII